MEAERIHWAAELMYHAKRRFIYFVGTAFVLFLILWFFSERIIYHIKVHMVPPEARWIVISPMEYIMTKIQLSLILAVVIILPFFIAFLLRRLHIEIQRKSLLMWGVPAVCLFLFGFFFTYYLLLPITFRILTLAPIEENQILPLYSISEFIFLTVLSTIIFSMSFELPLIVSWLSINGYVSVGKLTEKRRHVYVAVFILGAIITPDPTPVSQILLSVPLIFLYEASIISARLFGKKS